MKSKRRVLTALIGLSLLSIPPGAMAAVHSDRPSTQVTSVSQVPSQHSPIVLAYEDDEQQWRQHHQDHDRDHHNAYWDHHHLNQNDYNWGGQHRYQYAPGWFNSPPSGWAGDRRRDIPGGTPPGSNQHATANAGARRHERRPAPGRRDRPTQQSARTSVGTAAGGAFVGWAHRLHFGAGALQTDGGRRAGTAIQRHAVATSSIARITRRRFCSGSGWNDVNCRAVVVIPACS